MPAARAAAVLLCAAVVAAAQLDVPKVPAYFNGAIHTITKKEVTLDRGDGNVMAFSITHKTRFVKDGKEAKWSSFHQGDEVSLQSEEDFPGHFNALRVASRKPPPQN